MRKKILVLISVFTLLMSNLVVYAEDDNGNLGNNGNESITSDDYEEETITLKELIDEGAEFEEFEIGNVYSINTIDTMTQTLKAGKTGLSSGVKLTAGNTIYVGGVASPVGNTFSVGILQPNGVVRRVTGTTSVGHYFDITQTGTHKIYIYNGSNVSLTILTTYQY